MTGKHGFLYTVQPGDYLSKIAVRFKHLNVTVQRIKQDNQLTKDTLLPGQVLGINMASPARIPPTPPKQAVKPVPMPATQPAPQAPKSSPAKKPAAPPDVNTQAARSKDGKGEALALKAPEDGLVPWMKYAIAEAKQFQGAEEDEIEKTVNYHTDIKDGRMSLVGTLNAWCAAYVNWCLMRAGYPIRNPSENGYTDQAADTGRANGFRVVSMREEIPETQPADAGAKKGKTKKKYRVFKVDNPLYVKIDLPVYGAIGIVIGPGGNGHHAGFVYGSAGPNQICLLGGNQDQRIKFSPFHEKQTVMEELNTSGKVVMKKSDHLEFYLPVSYMPFYRKSSKDLDEVDHEQLNLSINIAPKKSKARTTTR